MKKSERTKIKKQLRAMARGAESRMPFWTIVDIKCCQIMRDAAKAIDILEKKLKKETL